MVGRATAIDMLIVYELVDPSAVDRVYRPESSR